jgi:hypothetical protein
VGRLHRRVCDQEPAGPDLKPDAVLAVRPRLENLGDDRECEAGGLRGTKVAPVIGALAATAC